VVDTVEYTEKRSKLI